MMCRHCILALFLVCAAHATQAQSLGEVADKSLQNSQYYSDMKLPEDVKTGASGKAEAQKAVDIVNSEEFQQNIEKEKGRLQKEVFGITPAVDGYYSDHAGGKERDGKRKVTLSADERIYIFVSSSVPEATLRAYAQDLEKLGSANAFMVMRGLIGGMAHFQPTFTFLSRVLLRDPDCDDGKNCVAFGAAVEIDPLLFRKYQPERVPAIVYVRGLKMHDTGLSEGDPVNVNSPADNSWWMLYGDSSLSYALEFIGKEAGIKKVSEIGTFLR
jgi:type-F conjugative transfer system pilin assembly protein TrbC